MRGLVWFITLALIALWSLISWIGYQLIEAGGRLIAGNADWAPVAPELVELISWLSLFGADVAGWLIIVVWGIVAAIIAALGFVATRLLPGPAR